MAVTREIAITYGSYTVTGIDGKIRIEKDKDRGAVTFSFIVTGADAGTFATNCVAAEDAFQKPYQALDVTLSGSTLFSGAQATRTYLDPIPEISKEEHKVDSGRSRRYTVRVEFGLPADTGADAVTGLRESFVDVAYSPSRTRKVSLSGTFTGVGATSARAQYEAQIDGWANTTLNALGITSANREISEEPSVRHDTNNNLCDFNRVYTELIFSQGGSSLNDTDIVNQLLTITRRLEGPGDTPVSERLATLDLTYEATIDKDQTTNLSDKYDSIRAWLLTQVTNTLNGGLFAVTMEEPVYDFDMNKLSARWTVMGQPSGQVVIEQRVTTDDDSDEGKEIVPIWGGNDTDAYVWQGPRIIIRTVTHVHKRVGTFNEQNAFSFGKSFVDAAKGRSAADARGQNWVTISRRGAATPLRMGVGTDTMDVTEMTYTERMRLVTSPAAVSGGSGGAVPTPGRVPL